MNEQRTSDSRCIDPECDHCAWNEALDMKEQLTATREEHMAWCKRRALQYVDRGDTLEGLTSMFSDLDQHPETGGTRAQK